MYFKFNIIRSIKCINCIQKLIQERSPFKPPGYTISNTFYLHFLPLYVLHNNNCGAHS